MKRNQAKYIYDIINEAFDFDAIDNNEDDVINDVIKSADLYNDPNTLRDLILQEYNVQIPKNIQPLQKWKYGYIYARADKNPYRAIFSTSTFRYKFNSNNFHLNRLAYNQLTKKRAEFKYVNEVLNLVFPDKVNDIKEKYVFTDEKGLFIYIRNADWDRIYIQGERDGSYYTEEQFYERWGKHRDYPIDPTGFELIFLNPEKLAVDITRDENKINRSLNKIQEQKDNRKLAKYIESRILQPTLKFKTTRPTFEINLLKTDDGRYYMPINPLEEDRSGNHQYMHVYAKPLAPAYINFMRITLPSSKLKNDIQVKHAVKFKNYRQFITAGKYGDPNGLYQVIWAYDVSNSSMLQTKYKEEALKSTDVFDNTGVDLNKLKVQPREIMTSGTTFRAQTEPNTDHICFYGCILLSETATQMVDRYLKWNER